MADEALLDNIHDLSDLELATLTSLIAQEHCIVDTDTDILDDLGRELELIAANGFGLSYTTIDCTPHTTLDDFATSVLVPDHTPTTPTAAFQSYFPIRQTSTSSPRFDLATKRLPNIIIAKNLNLAPHNVQIQALELMRTKRIFTRTSMQSAPKHFLFIALLAEGALTGHLNEHMFLSHWHDPEDGLPNLEDLYEDNDGASLSSVVKKSPQLGVENFVARISIDDIEHLTDQSQLIAVSVEVKRYQYNIISFLRLHRAVAGGISAMGTKYFGKLMRCLALLHALSYVTPSLVALAARKIYRHRIRITEPEKERSMQYGSDLAAVRELLDGVTAEDVIEDVLGSAGPEVPL